MLLSDGSQWNHGYADQPTYGNAGPYTGVVLDRTFMGDFAYVVSWKSATVDNARYTAHAIVSSPSASPSDFTYTDGEYYTPQGVLRMFKPKGAYTYKVNIQFYNNRDWDDKWFDPWPTTYYRYRRSANTVTLSYSSGATGPWMDIKSATVSDSDRILCLLGHCAGDRVMKTAVIQS